MRVIALVLAVAFSSVESIAQPLALVPSTLIVPAKYQKYFDSAHTINLPPGFTASVFYTGTLGSPRFMDFNPAGDLCIADQYNSTVLALPDADSDGVADTAITIATGTDNAHSIAFRNGNLFAASPNHVWRYDGPPKAGVYISRELFIDSIGSAAEGSPNHTTRTLLFDDASQSLFVSVGAPCNACRERDTTRASIQRYDLNGGAREIYATGLRNAVGLALDSGHQLWATVAERNRQDADIPYDLVTRIDKNGFYGWPFAYLNHQWENFGADSEYNALLPIAAADSMKVSTMRPPDAGVDAHSTPLGIVYCKNANLPAFLYNTLLVSIHGSAPSERAVANGSKIVLFKTTGVVKSRDFCTGFLTDSLTYTRWARPCGIIMDRKGNIYFSSDHTAPHALPAIYRISYNPNNAVERSEQQQNLIDVAQDMDGVNITIHSIDPYSVRLFDMLGRSLPMRLIDRGMSVDFHSFHLNSTGLAHGMYWIIVECGDQRVARRILQ